MILSLTGHNRLYDLQSIAGAFFPGASFREGEPRVFSALEPAGCRTRIEDSERSEEAFAPLAGSDKDSLRQAVKESFFEAACRFTGFTPDWGVFTGIRPAKEFARLGSTEAFCRAYHAAPSKAELCEAIRKERESIALPLGEREVSLYVSIPFCPTRCRYCSFISGAGEKMLARLPEYLEALERELHLLGALFERRGLRVASLYIGGGTPAVLSPDQLAALGRVLRESFDLSHRPEFTVELGRPDAITPEKLAAAREMGAGRVCVNPQTLNDSVLRSIGRAHTAEQFWQAFEAAKKAGFQAVNCDLIAGLAGDSLESFSASLQALIAHGAENITVHALCQKQGSDLKTQKAFAPQAREASRMIDFSIRALSEAGYAPYYVYKQKQAVAALENTGWEKGSTPSLYNILMMDDLATVLGAGAGSSSKIIGKGDPVRVYSPKYPYEYIPADPKEKIAALEKALGD